MEAPAVDRDALTTSPYTLPRSELRARRILSDWLAKADIQIDGNRPWDIHFNSPRLARRLLAGGSLTLGESYMDGDWEAPRLDAFFDRILSARLDREIVPAWLVFHVLKARIFNLQNKTRAWQVGERHYDLGNDFYAAMLDSRLTYTCGYWRDADNLEDAQVAKLDLICRKLELKPGMTVLDIGCGWGSFMAYAAEHYGVHCLGVTISKAQVNHVNQAFPHLSVEARLLDYREIDDTFDRIVSIGMFEHVGRRNHRTYMAVAQRCLKDDGLFLLHTIGRNNRSVGADPWISKYIFPNGELPSIGQIGDAVDDLFVVEDLHNFGADYDKTLMAWHANVEAAWPRFADRLGERFHRMWRYYLLSCAGAFRSRNIQLWQWVLHKTGVRRGYRRVS
jgi:cyclopropane-fatty-acyl-phospholipid synthase